MFKFKVSLSLTTLVLLYCLASAPTLISGTLNSQQIGEVAKLEDQSHFQTALQNILIPRVVGTEGWKRVQNYLINELKSMGMQVELDSFQDNTPIFGRLNFVNVIGRLNPNADKFLVLSAHYDSKYFPNEEFLGATDSAVPCAMILNILKTTLPNLKPMLEGRNIGLMVIFFDGEEAFKQWTATDSIYGSRNLAKKWSEKNYKGGKEIDRISVLVLLDLIGYGTPRFACTFRNTCELNRRLIQIESDVNRGIRQGSNSKMFLNQFANAGVEDDHIPFLKLGVPVLHLIPTRFPSVWHTTDDNGKSLNHASIRKLNHVMRAFVIDYFADCLSSRPSPNCYLE